METRVKGLQTQVIFLVDHDSDPAGQIYRRPGANRLVVQTRQLFADQVTLVQQQPIVWRQLVHAQQDSVFNRTQAAECLSYLGQDPQPLSVARPRSKGVALEVSRQTDSGRDDDVGVLAGRIQPACTAVG